MSMISPMTIFVPSKSTLLSTIEKHDHLALCWIYREKEMSWLFLDACRARIINLGLFPQIWEAIRVYFSASVSGTTSFHIFYDIFYKIRYQTFCCFSKLTRLFRWVWWINLMFQMKSSSRDGLLAHSTGCDMNDDDGGSGMGEQGLHMDDPVNVFPHKISTSTLKRGSAGSKRTFLLKEKRESIV